MNMFNDKENLRKYYKEYYRKNKEKYAQSIKKYQNSIKGIKTITKYKKKNKLKLNKWRKEYERERRKNDSTITLKKALLNRLRRTIVRYLSTRKIIPNKINVHYLRWGKEDFDEMQRIVMGFEGIDYEKVIKKLEPIPKDFSKNYQIDHIKPLYSFNFNNAKEIKKAFAPENLQIITIKENQSKGRKIL